MKIYRIISTLILLLLLIQIQVRAQESSIERLEKSSELQITLIEENSAIFQEKMTIFNSQNKSENFSFLFPVTWPYTINKTKYSIYPFYDWFPIKDVILYFNVSEIELIMKEILPIEYLKQSETYPQIPFIPFNGTLAPDKTTGFGTKIIDPKGLIERKNGTYELDFTGVTEGRMKTITVKIPHKIRKFWFLDADLRMIAVKPQFPQEPPDPQYKIFKWDKDFITAYIGDSERDVTLNMLNISYVYEIQFSEIGFYFIHNLGWIIIGIVIAGLIIKIKKRQVLTHAVNKH